MNKLNSEKFSHSGLTCMEALILRVHDHMDVGDRTMSGTIVEDAQEQ